MTTGIVLGKFYPPHIGHVALIEYAAERVDRVVVVVQANAFESIPLASRLRWLGEIFTGREGILVIGAPDDAPVAYDSDAAWAAHTAQLRTLLRCEGIGQLDEVIGSEFYIPELARRLGARPVVFDLERRAIPVSATAIRGDLSGQWNQLPGAVRRGLALRVIVLGAESTGTTTLASALTRHYREHGYPAILDVPEYGREHTVMLHERQSATTQVVGDAEPSVAAIQWDVEDFEEIARRQLQLEDAAALAAPLVIADTDSLATTIWERRYLGDSRGSRTVVEAGMPRRALYLLTDDSIPFEQDGWRDGEQLRATMTEWFATLLTDRRESWFLAAGTPDERLSYAIDAIDALIAHEHRFASPPWAAAPVTAP